MDSESESESESGLDTEEVNRWLIGKEVTERCGVQGKIGTIQLLGMPTPKVGTPLLALARQTRMPLL